MNQLDQKISQALQAASSSINICDDETLLHDAIETFRGQHRWLLILAWIKCLFFIGVTLFSIYQFFQQDSVLALIAYATLCVIGTITIATTYLFFWVSVNQQATLREVKRLELQVALLINQMQTRQDVKDTP